MYSISLSSTRQIRCLAPSALPVTPPPSTEDRKKTLWVQQLMSMPDIRDLAHREVSLSPKEIASKLLGAEPYLGS